MDSALVISALLMGLAGGPHCAAMCGAACSAVAGRGRGIGGATAPSLLALHSGRVVGYAAMGALAAAGVAAIGTFSSAAPMVRPLWAIVHVAAFALGLWLAAFGRAPGWLSAASLVSRCSRKRSRSACTAACRRRRAPAWRVSPG